MHTPHTKSELRNTLRERRRAVPPAVRARAGIAVASHLKNLPDWDRAEHVALYLPADGEIDTAQLAQHARKAGLSLYLPVVSGDGLMQFALWQQQADLALNCYGIPEPGPQYPLRPPDKLDVIFMPLVGWTRNGVRLGMGGGFYDRALANTCGPIRVGLGFECQRTDELPVEDWDIPMDFVVTEAALHACRRKS
jgi:5-formyltetrahydrofolate cyclo-ligase